MIAIQVESIDIHQARKLSGKNFFVAEGKLAVAEKEITLTTSAPEGFNHIKGNCIFLYAEEISEDKENNEVVWTCGLVDENSKTLMLTNGKDTICDLTIMLQNNLRKLVNFPNVTGQYIRFEYNSDQWEMSILPNFRSTEIMLRKIIKTPLKKHGWGYDPVFLQHQYKISIDFYCAVEHFREEVVNYYSPLTSIKN
ncbi:hypothetical protein [Aeromonas phage AerS_266]|nr:hypothetical protein [Aeromonas phage AerS_266]